MSVVLSSISASSPMIAESESQEIAQRSMDVVNTAASSEMPVSSDFFLPLVAITIILGGLTAFYVWKFRKSSLK